MQKVSNVKDIYLSGWFYCQQGNHKETDGDSNNIRL
jgi:hypothetical protein